MKTFSVPLNVHIFGFLVVEAENAEEATKKAGEIGHRNFELQDGLGYCGLWDTEHLCVDKVKSLPAEEIQENKTQE